MRNPFKIVVFFTGLLLILISACSGNVEEPDKQQVSPVYQEIINTITLPHLPTSAAQLTDTITLTHTSAPTKSLTPISTLQLPVSLLTPVPEAREQITTNNIGKLTALAKWGEGVVCDVQFSSDGEEIFVLATPGLYRINAETFDVIEFLENITAFSISPDGTFFVTRDRDKAITLQYMNGKKAYLVPKLDIEVKKYSEPFYWLQSTIVISSDSKFIAAICSGEIRLWNSDTGRLLFHAGYFEKGVQEILISNDCTKLLALHTFDQISVWNLQTYELEKTIITNYGSLTSMTMTSDNKKLLFFHYYGRKKVMIVWDASRYSHLFILDNGLNRFNSFAISPDGNLLVSGGFSRMDFWDLNTGELIDELDMDGSIRDLGFSPDGRFFSAVSENNIVFYETETLKESFRIDFSMEGQRKLVFSRDSSKFFTYGESTGIISLGYIGERSLVKEKRLFSGEIQTVGYLASKDIYVWGGTDGFVTIVSGVNGERIKQFNVRSPINRVSLSPDEKYLAVSRDDGVLEVRNTENWALFCRISTGEKYGLNAIFSPSGDILASNYNFWNFPECELLPDITTGYSFCLPKAANTLVFVEDDKRFILGCGNGKVILRDLVKNVSTELRAHTIDVQDIFFYSSGNFFATVSLFDPVRIWSFPEHELLIELNPEGRSGIIYSSVAVLDDGELLAAADTDGNIIFWDITTGKQISFVNSYYSDIKDLILIHNEHILVSVGTGGEVILWGIP